MNNGMLGFAGPITARVGEGFEAFTSGTNAAWIWPNGVRYIDVALQAAGGGSTNGTDSTITYDGVTYTANAGQTNGIGGSGGNGDVSVAGGNGIYFVISGYTVLIAGGAQFGRPGMTCDTGVSVAPSGYGAGDTTTTTYGGGDECIFKRLFRKPGQDILRYTLGAAGTGATGALLIIQYDPPELSA